MAKIICTLALFIGLQGQVFSANNPTNQTEIAYQDDIPTAIVDILCDHAATYWDISPDAAKTKYLNGELMIRQTGPQSFTMRMVKDGSLLEDLLIVDL